jgi:hypothetical protein
MDKRWFGAGLALAVVLPLMVTGCGGGSVGSSGGRLSLFASDSFRDDYTSVWATLMKVEVIAADGSAVVVFDEPEGKTLDLAALRDASGPRFAFLGNATVPEGDYKSVRVTFAPNLTVLPKEQSTTQALAIHPNVTRDASGNAVVTQPLAASRRLGTGSDDLVVDFDLANFKLQGGKLIPALLEGERTSLGVRSRHESEDYEGTVSALTGNAGSQSFTLTYGPRTFTVKTDANTVVYRPGASTALALANGLRVEARGTYDPATDTLLATSVKIEDGASSGSQTDEDEAKGAPSAVDANAGTFSLTIGRAEGFVPDRTVITVVTNAGTAFRGERGAVYAKADFFTRLATQPFVEAEGTYDPATGILTAKSVKLEHGRPGHEHEDGPGDDDDLHDDHDDDDDNGDDHSNH